MEDNLRQQLENTFSTCRRSPRILGRTVKETPPTVRKPSFAGYNSNPRYDEQGFNSPEGILLLGFPN